MRVKVLEVITNMSVSEHDAHSATPQHSHNQKIAKPSKTHFSVEGLTRKTHFSNDEVQENKFSVIYTCLLFHTRFYDLFTFSCCLSYTKRQKFMYFIIWLQNSIKVNRIYCFLRLLCLFIRVDVVVVWSGVHCSFLFSTLLGSIPTSIL